VFTFIIHRLLALIPTLLLVSVVVFVLLSLAPGDPAALILGEDAPPEALAALRQQLGFDEPVAIRYAKWLYGVVRGDFGESIFFRAPVLAAIADRLEPTLLLTIGGGVLAVALGIPLGILAANRRNTWIDQTVMMISLIGVSMPNFWLGLNLILVFALWLQWLPGVGYVQLADEPGRTLRHLILPILTLGLSHVGLIARMTRANMLEVLREDYIRTAQAKGVSDRVKVYKHGLRNAMIPTITVIGLTFAVLLGGATVTEQVFVIPGVGRLIVESVARRDFPVVQAVVMLSAVVYVLVNLTVDVAYALIDPRVVYG